MKHEAHIVEQNALHHLRLACREVNTAIVLTPCGVRRAKLNDAHAHLALAENQLKEIISMEQDDG